MEWKSLGTRGIDHLTALVFIHFTYKESDQDILQKFTMEENKKMRVSKCGLIYLSIRLSVYLSKKYLKTTLRQVMHYAKFNTGHLNSNSKVLTPNIRCISVFFSFLYSFACLPYCFQPNTK